MQLNFFFAPVTRATKAPATKRVVATAGAAKPPGPAPQPLSVAAQLNSGVKVAFPKNTNAIRVAFGSKTVVILKADADTLKGAGVATTVEFGTVKNDAKGHPNRKNFEAWTAPVNNDDPLAGTLALSLQ